jgi:hypothetical protein
MSSLIETITQQLSGNVVRQVGNQLGTNEIATSGAIAAALPVLLSALARNAASPTGATALNQALAKDHDGSVFEDTESAVANADSGPGAKILSHVFGGRQTHVAAGLGQATGLDSGQASSLLAMLAPLVMGALGRAQRNNGLDAGGLAAMLGQEKQQIGASAGALGGLLGMLDRDGDGSAVDDLLGAATRMFGNR